jgi:hypothetical protein
MITNLTPKILNCCNLFQVSSFKFQVSGFKFQVSRNWLIAQFAPGIVAESPQDGVELFCELGRRPTEAETKPTKNQPTDEDLQRIARIGAIKKPFTHL